MNRITRGHFLKLLPAACVVCGRLGARAAEYESLQAGSVGWARLKTASPYWKRHAGADPTLTQFFRDETTLNIDLIWHQADVDNLDALCEYPFLFSQGVGVVAEPAERRNLAEYIRRGGFVLVDACHDIHVTPDFDEFLSQQIEFYAAALPEAKIVSLPATHDVYRCFFPIPGGRPPHTFMSNIYDPIKARHGLYGVMIGSRMAGIISLCGWQCGWDHVTEHRSQAPPGTDLACMRMVVNIYLYSIIQSG
jgi:hypothetical protein